MILYCPRTCNRLAHELTEKGAQMAGEPDFLSDGLIPFVSGLVMQSMELKKRNVLSYQHLL
jgi:hypothetical protein